MYGICASGGYIPRNRLSRESMYRTMGWYNAANIAYASGERSVANFDEDSITMAVAAARATLPKRGSRSSIDGLYFASTSLPYADRQNAGIIATALSLRDDVRAADFSGSRKAGSTAILAALDAVAGGSMKQAVVCSGECRPALSASPQEMLYGDAAAAVLIGSENVLAEFKGSYSTTHDFVDRYRGSKSAYDRQWEDRWIRDMGYAPLLGEAVGGLLKKYGLKITDFAAVAYDCHYSAVRKALNKKIALPKGVDVDNFQETVGHCGAAHSLIMLVRALESAKPGDKVLVVSFGSGCDALYFEVTDNINAAQNIDSLSKSLARGEKLDSYMKYLIWKNILPADGGLRAEEDQWTRWSYLWRRRKQILGLWGTRCTKCGTPQYPEQRICANPECGAVDAMEPYCFADKTGTIVSYTGDNMAPSVEPPAMYGHIAFEGGGKYLFDFTECKLSDLGVGTKMQMSFRRKYYDSKRDISGYFWKAVPCEEVAK